MPISDRVCRVGTRKSRLARIQTESALCSLQASDPQVRFETIGIATHGDRNRAVSIPELGEAVFTKELETALLNHEIDLAVHSLKDLPTELPLGLCLAAVLTREDPRDALVSRDSQTLDQLRSGARIGTGSPRRGGQLLARRPDLQIVLLRGNVDTRVRKVLDDGEADAAVLAVAGLKRLRMEHVIAEYFDPSVILPAIGQGFLAIETREQDTEFLNLAQTAEDREARHCADAERAFLIAVGGGCKAPVAAYATFQDGKLAMDGIVATLDGKRVLQAHVQGDLLPIQAGLLLRERLYALGAEEIIAVEESAGV